MEPEKETALAIVLPVEVRELAVQVSEKKQAEVQTILTQVFNGTADWEKQIDGIEIKGIEDKLSINLADAARKNVKSARVAAEKIFDSKREAVQQLKSEYDVEDKLWLKAKQVMQIKFKAIEEKAEWKAKFVERHEAEQKELRTLIRIEKVKQFAPDLNHSEFENTSNEMFDILLAGLEKSHNDKIEADRKAELERIEKEKADEAERERINAENERLRAEQAKIDEINRIRDERNEELRPYIIFIRDYNEMLEMDENSYQSELEEIKEAAQMHYQTETKKKAEAKRIEDENAARLAIVEAERERIAKELQDKEDAENAEKIRVEFEKSEAEKAKKLEEKRLAAMPDKIKLNEFALMLDVLVLPELKSEEAQAILVSAKTLLTKVSNYIRENTEKL